MWKALVIGFMRSLPTWAYHGGGRSMGDLGNNGKWFVNRGVERGAMHYRAGKGLADIACSVIDIARHVIYDSRHIIDVARHVIDIARHIIENGL